MKRIDLFDLNQKLQATGGQLSSNELVLDVRTAEEFAEGHIRGARLIPHEEVAPHADSLKKYDTVYIICRAGSRAQRAFAALTQAGLNNMVVVADSGMRDWYDAGYPVEK